MAKKKNEKKKFSRKCTAFLSMSNKYFANCWLITHVEFIKMIVDNLSISTILLGIMLNTLANKPFLLYYLNMIFDFNEITVLKEKTDEFKISFL